MTPSPNPLPMDRSPSSQENDVNPARQTVPLSSGEPVGTGLRINIEAQAIAPSSHPARSSPNTISSRAQAVGGQAAAAAQAAAQRAGQAARRFRDRVASGLPLQVRRVEEEENTEPFDARAGVRIRSWTVSALVHLVLFLVLMVWAIAPSGSRGDGRFTGGFGGFNSGATGFDQIEGFDEPLASPALNPIDTMPIDTTLPATALSDNLLTVDASGVASRGRGSAGGLDGDFGDSLFGDGSETIKGVAVKVGDPQFTLLWDTRTDIDLHVWEPGGAHIYWNERRSAQGGELDVDNTQAFGPENIYWTVTDEKGNQVKTNGPPGEYVWKVHFYGAPSGLSIPTRWKVRVKHKGKVQIYSGVLKRIGEWSRPFTLTVSPSDSSRGD
ncbi:hypothetical protein Isop_3495 [Isosphaera pallida ATCC 43644]|uniref:DUF2135 domain-containing protein n=1 Tax=Isosphaera pallida (strain ATCC 43644 / DSM 9630 / IS1B) TaxID=575540 RepID=E8QX13_ISOPI|nr:hypothetical protein [Isosphaera pallida]ADV64052.1 hypothetical protein Isop_3495 [Isosphaera pallida ATCC 43644]